MCIRDSRKLFPAELETGMAFEGLPPGSVTPGMPADVVYIVTEIYPSHVVLDGNHPLAGMALRMDIQVRGVRAATEGEVDKRSVSAGESAVTVLGQVPRPADGTLH